MEVQQQAVGCLLLTCSLTPPTPSGSEVATHRVVLTAHNSMLLRPQQVLTLRTKTHKDFQQLTLMYAKQL